MGGAAVERGARVNLIFRILRVLIAARFRPRVHMLEETTVRFRVWPSDLDPLMHMNNGRYLTIMDLGRADAILRSGLRRRLASHHVYPVVASEMIRFRESLPLLARFELRTRLLGWDDRSFYIHQRFTRRGRDVAVALVRVRFLRRAGGTIAAPDVAALVAPDVSRPALPDHIAEWQRAESALSAR